MSVLEYTLPGVLINRRLHRRKPTDELRSGPQTRRGRYVAKKGRCVSCYALAPPSHGGGRKKTMCDGSKISQSTYACDVCRVLLCKRCFYDETRYDHRTLGHVYDSVVL